MSTKIQKAKPAAKVGSSAVERFASNPATILFAGTAVKGQDERQNQAPLTAFPAGCTRLSFFPLTPAVVVIDGMTSDKEFAAEFPE